MGFSCIVFDGKKHVDVDDFAKEADGNGEEIRCCNQVSVTFEEVSPSVAITIWNQSMLHEHVGYARFGDSYFAFLEFANDPA